MLTGIHASAAGGLGACAARVREMGIPAAQFFTSNPRRYNGSPVPESDANEFRRSSDKVVWLSHCSYLVNMASCRPDIAGKSREALQAELFRCSQLGVPFCVLHPGSATGQSMDEALARAAESIRDVLQQPLRGCPVLLLENTSGAGGALGADLDRLLELVKLIGLPERTGVCIDTAHAHGFGYELDSGGKARDFCRQISAIFGESIKAFHLNDSMVQRGSGCDRHQVPGLGTIGLEALSVVESFPGFSGVPAVLETPGEDRDRLAGLRLITGRDQY